MNVARLSKQFGTGVSAVAALADVTFDMPGGGSLALMGPSGSGKSTLLHVLGALITPDSGSVTIDSVDVTALSSRGRAAHRRSTGFIFQRFNLLSTLTALDNVVAPAIPGRVAFDRRTRAKELLSDVGLLDKARSFPGELSGGQQQRVAIARALMNSPSLLLADEPTGNLDSAQGAAILDLLFEVHLMQKGYLVVATHDPVVADRCDAVLELRDGRLTSGAD